MDNLRLTSQQLEISSAPLSSHIFLEGPSGAGKTTVGVERLTYLLRSGVPGDQILILVPQRTLASPYYMAIQDPRLPSNSLPDVLTLGGLGQRMIQLFWPLIAPLCGFGNPTQPPAFLTLETAQYYLARLVDPLLEKGYFESIVLDHNRLLSQIIDNLNKAVLVGFPIETIAERLTTSLRCDPGQVHAFQEAQECALLFRKHCLENNLLDFSLQMDIFVNHLWPTLLVRQYLSRRYRHLIYDNLEEDSAVVHDVVREWLGDFESSLLIFDQEGGYRAFLGADSLSGYSLKQKYEQEYIFNASYITSQPLEDARNTLEDAFLHRKGFTPSPALKTVMEFEHQRYYPQMVEWVCQKTGELIEHGVPPGDIAILSPFLSDSLRYSLSERMEQLQIPVHTNRPSRSLSAEPATRCLLTLAKLAHLDWGFTCSRNDVRNMLLQAVDGFDLVRADLLTQIVYGNPKAAKGLGSFEQINGSQQVRITYTLGERYSILRNWLTDYSAGEPQDLDIFLSRLFGEVLSQPGFGFHRHFDRAKIAYRLIESVQKFRRSAAPDIKSDPRATGKEYIRMVEAGVIAAQYLPDWEELSANAVFIAPAYTFLMRNQPVHVQFWLDIGSLGWWERVYQPLTHPYVLSRHWNPGDVWTDVNDFQSNQANMQKLVSGLIRRCSGKVYLCATSVNEQGNEQRGPLLQGVQSILRRLAMPAEDYHV